jgi:PleD family two-component response regulator
LNDETQQKPRILAVDDSRVMRRAMSKVLSKEYDVVEVENGEDAWTILLNDDLIQVVFTDLSMPFLDGYKKLPLSLLPVKRMTKRQNKKPSIKAQMISSQNLLILYNYKLVQKRI